MQINHPYDVYVLFLHGNKYSESLKFPWLFIGWDVDAFLVESLYVAFCRRFTASIQRKKLYQMWLT
jgi:hypothetical protein